MSILLLLLLLLLWSCLTVTISLVSNCACTPHCRSLGARAGLTYTDAVNDVACSQRKHWLLGLFRRFLFRTVIRITEHTEYQFPKEQTLCYSQNKIADVTKINAMRPRKCRYAIFPLKDGRKLPKEHDYRLFCLFRIKRYPFYSVNSNGSRIYGIHCLSFRNQNRSQKNTILTNSVYSHYGIVP